MTDVSAVLVTYRSAAYVGKCLAALGRALAEVDAEVIVVDNHSDDGTTDAVRRSAPGARLVPRLVNDGFGAGCHVGADLARGRHLLFVNPDALVEPGAVAALLDCARRHPRAGIVGGRCVTGRGESDPRSWWGRPTSWSLLCFALGLTTMFPGHRLLDPESPRPWIGSAGEERAVPIVTGALMLVDRELWDRTGGFDRAFFMYGEDADLCMRAAAMGWRPMVTAAAAFVHPGGMSSTGLRKQILLFTGKSTLVRRHLPRGLRGVGLAQLRTGVWLRATVGRWVPSPRAERQGRPTTGAQNWRALWEARGQWTRGWA